MGKLKSKPKKVFRGMIRIGWKIHVAGMSPRLDRAGGGLGEHAKELGLKKIVMPVLSDVHPGLGELEQVIGSAAVKQIGTLGRLEFRSKKAALAFFSHEAGAPDAQLYFLAEGGEEYHEADSSS